MRQRKCPICRLAENLPLHESCHIKLYAKLHAELLNLEWKIFKMEMLREEKHRGLMEMLYR